MEIVGSCPLCGAPIYGQRILQQSPGTPTAYDRMGYATETAGVPAYTCACRELLQELLRTEREAIRASIAAVMPPLAPEPSTIHTGLIDCDCCGKATASWIQTRDEGKLCPACLCPACLNTPRGT